MFKVIIHKISVLVGLSTPVVTVITESAVQHDRSRNSGGSKNFLSSYFVITASRKPTGVPVYSATKPTYMVLARKSVR